jgi:hypothetical protein
MKAKSLSLAFSSVRGRWAAVVKYAWANETFRLIKPLVTPESSGGQARGFSNENGRQREPGSWRRDRED